MFLESERLLKKGLPSNVLTPEARSFLSKAGSEGAEPILIKRIRRIAPAGYPHFTAAYPNQGGS